jgi:hypothetical protein
LEPKPFWIPKPFCGPIPSSCQCPRKTRCFWKAVESSALRA